MTTTPHPPPVARNGLTPAGSGPNNRRRHVRKRSAASVFSTLIIMGGTAAAVLTSPAGGAAVDIFRHYALVFGVALIAFLIVESQGNLKRLIRVDIAAITVLYFLTFAEYLDPRLRVLFRTNEAYADQACLLVALSISMIALGRHFPIRIRNARFNMPHISSRSVFGLSLALFFLGYLWPLITVDFNPITLVEEAFGPRFTQPWSRGRFGGWTSFLTELDLLHFPFAALSGYFLAAPGRRKGAARIAIVALLAFMLMLDFAQGTRYILIIKIGLATSGYILASQRISNAKSSAIAVFAALAVWFIAGELVQMRNVGLDAYLTDPNAEQSDRAFMIDNNLNSMTQVMGIIPNEQPYLGMSVLSSAATTWVPRALWPGKPLDLSSRLEEVFQTGGDYTVSVSYVGEAYLIWGIWSVLGLSFVLGAGAGLLDQYRANIRSNFDLLLYLSMFFPVVLGMRSLQFATVGAIPFVAMLLFGLYLRRGKASQS